jgi:hypothetical protein
MRALSVWNPWAWALVAGIKPYENRSWLLPSALRGKRVLIHCGLHKPTDEEVAQVEWAAGELGVPMPVWARKPVGGLVGSLIFDGDLEAQDADNLWATGPRCWRVQPGSAVCFKAAIPCKGLQGFFTPPPEVLARFDARRAS